MNEILEIKRIMDVPAVIETTTSLDIEDQKYLLDRSEHFQKVFNKTHIWRTDYEKQSIISDFYHPTTHSKFHQALMEQKVQIDQLFQLAKEYEMKKLEGERIQIEYDDLEEKIKTFDENQETKENKLTKVDFKKKKLELDFITYDLQNMKIMLDYRLKEVKGWDEIEESLIQQLRDEGFSESQIWDKGCGQMVSLFFIALNRFAGIGQSTDAGEVENLTALLIFSIQQTKLAGAFDQLIKHCNENQLKILKELGAIPKDK